MELLLDLEPRTWRFDLELPLWFISKYDTLSGNLLAIHMESVQLALQRWISTRNMVLGELLMGPKKRNKHTTKAAASNKKWIIQTQICSYGPPQLVESCDTRTHFFLSRIHWIKMFEFWSRIRKFQFYFHP